jgi:DNA-binding MarR family transcriptional regulator
MRIEEALNMSNGFAHGWQKTLANVIVTYQTIKQEMSQFLEPYGVTFQQYNVLRILNGSKPHPLTNNAIQERMLDKQSDVSRIVARLIKMELVEKCVNPINRRELCINLTAKGLELVEMVKTAEDVRFKNTIILSVKEMEQLNKLLDKMRG